jgi:hypothetical protein
VSFRTAYRECRGLLHWTKSDSEPAVLLLAQRGTPYDRFLISEESRGCVFPH